MWFKQAQILHCSSSASYGPEKLAAQLTSLSYQPCLPSLPATQGWVSPLEQDDAPLVHAVDNYWLLCLQIEEKILPATVVRQAVKQRVRALETEREHKVSRKEKTQLAEEMTQTLLPQAFSKYSRVYAYIDRRNNWLVVDSSAPVKTKQLVDFLHRSAPELKLKPVETKKVSSILTHWLLKQSYPQTFAINQACLLKDSNNENRMIRCQQQNLFAPSIQALLKEGCEAHQLALTWHDHLDFTLSSEFIVKGVRYHEELKEQSDDAVLDSQVQRLDADLVLMAGTLSAMLSDLLPLFVAEKEEAEVAIA